MSEATALLALPLLAAAQAQKHVTHNEALVLLDTLVQLAVLDKDLTSPPASPAEGDRYLIAGANPSGAWAGWAGRVVRYQDGAWTSAVPRPGWLAFVLDEGELYLYAAGAWVSYRTTLTVLQNLQRLGIGTTADAANPFAAKLNAALWTALGTGEGGTGDLRTTLNKEAAGNTLSLLFQSGWSGRAEIGLTGDDDLHLKVSADGSSWTEALRLDRTTGGADFRVAEVAVASAATVDLGAIPALAVTITGTSAITSFGSAPRCLRLLRFAGALSLTHNAGALILPGGASLTTAAGDTGLALSDGAGTWRVIAYQRASGRPLNLLTAGDLAAGAVTPSRMTLADPNNIILNPDFAAGADGWLLNAAAIQPASAAPSGAPAETVLRRAAGTSNADVYASNSIQVSPGEVYFVEAWFAAEANTTGTLRVGLHCRDVGKTGNAWITATPIPGAVSTQAAAATTSWTRLAGLVTIPATVNGNRTGWARFWSSHDGAASPAGASYLAAAKMRIVPVAATIGDATGTGRALLTATSAAAGAGALGLGTGNNPVFNGLVLNAAAGNFRTIYFQSGSSNRWTVFVDNGAESGANAGSNFRISRWNDGGTSAGDPLVINRASGQTTLSSLAVSGTTGLTGAVSFTPSAALQPISLQGSGQTNKLQIHPWLNNGAYSNMTKAGDQGLFWYGSASDNANAGGLVLAPWSSNAYGIRITYDGRVGVNKSAPAVALDVVGAVAATGGVSVGTVLTLGAYTVATVPAGTAGQQIYVSDARKAGEASGSGTGVLACYSNGAWRRLSDDTAIAA
ncbi:DUF2793 domain-containing protein [Methylobacterium sp. ID0610]|uniref:DUF2793 domain-containing protein n=1 Tax=Methylobacterium carpenticola TaxID=3344827 RepID=UPI00368F9B73